MTDKQAGYRPISTQLPASAPSALVEPGFQQPAKYPMAGNPNLFEYAVAMGDQPYRTIGQRASSPSEFLTVEQFADLRLCTSSLSPAQCRELISKLDDIQVKNAVYDRVLCFPHADFTKGIQDDFAKKVKAINKNVISFVNYYTHIQTILDGQKSLFVFKEEDYQKLETDFKSYISPSIDGVGVYSTFSDYSMTKRNGLTTIIEIGLFLLDIPIFRTPQGKACFTYDCLSRAVANILHSAANPLQRQQILEHGIEEGLRGLEKRGQEIGIFLSLSKALSPDPISSPYFPYWLPEIQPQTQPQPQPKPGKKRKPRGEGAAPTKKVKRDTDNQHGNVTPHQNVVQSQQGVVHQQQDVVQTKQEGVVHSQQSNTNSQQRLYDPKQASVHCQQGTVDPQEGTTVADHGDTSLNGLIDPRLWESQWPQSDQPSSEHLRGVNEGSPAASDGSHNRFGTPTSTGGQNYVSSLNANQQQVPSGGFGTPSSTVGQTQVQSRDGYQQQVPSATQQNRELSQKPAIQYGAQHPMYYQRKQKNATQHLGAAQPAQQGQGSEKATSAQAAGAAPTGKKPRAKRTSKKQAEEATAQATAAETPATEPPVSQESSTPDTFEDITREAYQEVYVSHVHKDAHMQTIIAGIVARRVEGGCRMILSRLAKCGEVHRDPEVFAKSQENALWAFLWHLEACAIDRAGTALSAAVARVLIGDQIVKYFWACLMRTTSVNMKRLLESVDGNGVSFEVKLDAIIQTLNNTGIPGWGRLQYILDEMRATAAEA